MKLLSIEIIKELQFKPISPTLFLLTAPYEVKFKTTDGIWHLKNKEGWLTDLRSGSSIVDYVIPKMGNDLYTASVLLHDTSFSGWISFELANELLYQGMIMSDEIGKYKALITKKAVTWFGSSHYYDLSSALPKPYTTNRIFEYLELKDK